MRSEGPGFFVALIFTQKNVHSLVVSRLQEILLLE